MRVFVAGGTGVVGRPLVDALVARGHQVSASARRSANLPIVAALGARPVLMDGLDQAAVHRAITETEPELIVNLMTALSSPAADYGAWLEVTNRLRIEGTKILMSAASEAGTRRVVAQSASFMTAPGQDLTDESSPLYLDAPGPIGIHIRANVVAEELVLGTTGIDGVVLRYGFLYGAGTSIGPGGDIAVAIGAGELPIVGDGAGRYPLIHVDDAVAATLRSAEQGDPGVYNIMDDEPAAQAEWLPYLAGILDAPLPRRISATEAAETLGVQAVYYGDQLPAATNGKAKAALGWTLTTPSWRDGFRTVFGG
ncbi:NAD(P)H-binding protein [Kribbella ginsengisoli]|uniref:NAD(P)H-binding protein n=2 Tax=Kribbella ginsengisoli TaxID=363865 RepID=A0ABP6YK51_9ACTN